VPYQPSVDLKLAKGAIPSNHGSSPNPPALASSPKLAARVVGSGIAAARNLAVAGSAIGAGLMVIETH
jgi:hypothetical protein